MATSRWFFVVDHRQGRLVRGERSPVRAHCREVGRLINEFHSHRHERPSSLAGPSAHGYAGLPHEVEEQRDRFANAAAAWLAKQCAEHEIGRILVIGPGHLLGALRKAWPPPLAQRVEEHEGELSGLTASELARHPVIARALLARET